MTATLFLLASHFNAVVAFPKSSVDGEVSNFQPDIASVLASNFDLQDVSSMGLQRTVVVRKAAVVTADDASVMGLQRNIVVRKAIVADESLGDEDASVMGLQRNIVVRKAIVADESLGDEAEFEDTAVLGLQQSLKVNIRSKSTPKVEVLQLDEDTDALDAIVLEDSDEEASSLFGLQRSSTVQQRSQPVQVPSMRVSSRAPVSRPVVVRSAHCSVGGRSSSVRS